MNGLDEKILFYCKPSPDFPGMAAFHVQSGL